MKKLFLTISITALMIILIAAVLALLTVYELVPFFSKLLLNEPPAYPEDQATILVAYVDSVEDRQIQVEDAWLVYIVTSRMDTAIIQQAQQAEVSPKLLRKSVTKSNLIRQVEKDENIKIDYIFMIDGEGRKLINELLENQQSSINLNDFPSFCEILNSNEVHLFDLYIKYAEQHIFMTIPASLIEQFVVNENLTDSLYCESIEP